MLKLFMKSRNQKGFTLVELIVVLVILGILAAILVPTMIGWIDKSKEAQYQLEARSVLMACQAELAEAYGNDPSELDDAEGYLNGATVLASIESLSGVDITSTPAFVATVAIETGITGNESETEITALTFTFTSSNGGTSVIAAYTAGTGWEFSYPTTPVTP